MQVDLGAASPAVLVLDIQTLFTAPDGPFENTAAGTTIDALNAFLPRARSLGLPVYLSSYMLRDDLADAGLLRGMPVVEAGQFCASSEWMRLDQRLACESSDIRLRRNRPSAFFGTDLEAQLRETGIDTIVLAGLSVNNAISATARDAFARDFPTLVVRECTGAAPWETQLSTYFDILATWTAEVDTADQVIARLQGRGG